MKNVPYSTYLLSFKYLINQATSPHCNTIWYIGILERCGKIRAKINLHRLRPVHVQFFWKCMCFRNISHLAFGNQASDWLTCLVNQSSDLCFQNTYIWFGFRCEWKFESWLLVDFFTRFIRIKSTFLGIVLKISTYLF